MKKFLSFVSLLILSVSLSYAQTNPPSVAKTGITSDTPQYFEIYNKNGVWIPAGKVFNDHYLLPIGNGGTGATTPIDARHALGAQSDISTIPATDAGMVPDGTTDNSDPTLVQNLMNLVMPAANGGSHVVFNPVNGQQFSPYHFIRPLPISRAGTWDCGGYSPPVASAGAMLVFDAGINGVQLDDSHVSPDGGSFQSGTFENCYVRSLGYGTTNYFTAGDGTLTVTMQGVGTSGQPGYIPPSVWGAGDGFILWGEPTTFNIIQDTLVDGSFVGTGEISGGIFTIDSIFSGTFVLGAPILGGGGAMVQPNVGLIYATKYLGNSNTTGPTGPSTVGAQYSINQPGIPDKPSTIINSNYSTMTVPPTVNTTATAAWAQGDTIINIRSGTCSAKTPAGVDLYDITSSTRLGSVLYCIPDSNGIGHDTVYLTGLLGAAAASSGTYPGSPDSLKFWSVTRGSIGISALWVALSPITREAASTPDTHAFQISSSEDDNSYGGGGTYILSYSQPNVTATSSQGYNYQTEPASPPGSYITAASTPTGGTQTLTIQAGFYPKITVPPGVGYLPKIYQLPQKQAYQIVVDSPSSPSHNQFTVTQGPSADPTRKLWPGDFIVSRAYPYGCVVDQVSGDGGSQVVTITSSAADNLAANLTLGTGMIPCQHIGAGTYYLWVMPSGIRVFPQSHINKNFTYGFPIGINFYTSARSVPPGLATGTIFQSNSMFYGLVGLLEAGDNNGASAYIRNEGAHNAYVDFASLGGLGNAHLADNGNSSEEDGYLSIITRCSSSNLGTFDGSYFGFVPWTPSCASQTGMLFQPTHVDAGLGAPWIFNPYSYWPLTMGALSRNGFSGTTVNFAPDVGTPGVWFDTRYPNTTGATFNMYFTTHAGGSSAYALTMAYNPKYDNWQMGLQGTSTLAQSTEVFPAGQAWIANGGYTAGGSDTQRGRVDMFTNGFTFGDVALVGGLPGNSVPGGERLFDAGQITIANASQAGRTAAQPFIANSEIIAVDDITGLAAGRTVTDTTIGPDAILGTIASANITQNWLVISGLTTPANASSTENNVLVFDGANPITASDWYDTGVVKTMTMIPVNSCAGVPIGTHAVKDLTDNKQIASIVTSCGPGQPTMVLVNNKGAGVNSAGTYPAPPGTPDTFAVALRRHGDCRFNLLPALGGNGEWCVMDNAGTVAPAKLIAAEPTGKVWPSTSSLATIDGSSKPNGVTCDTTKYGDKAEVTNGRDFSTDGYGAVVTVAGTHVRELMCTDIGWVYH